VQDPFDPPGGTIGPLLPKANTTRRLLGSGIEFTSYVIGAWAIATLDAGTFGLLGLLTVALLGLIVLRDFNGGAFSIAKRVSQTRVVDWRSGRRASNPQALLRNSYYLALPAVAILPWVDCLTSSMFMLFIALDIMMILANRQGRRLGDLLAGTQVVEARV